MKTIEEAAEEFSKYSMEQYGFKAGIEFAESWIPVEEELPENNNEFPFVKYLVLVDIYAINYMCQTETVATFDNGAWKTDRTDPDIERIEVIKWRPISRK